MDNKKLAINGGAPAVPKDFKFKVWPEITKVDYDYVLASLNQDNHAWGPNCVALGEEWAWWNGHKFALATNSGTAALHMCLAACGVGPGDEVITTTTSWTSTATAVLHHNAIPTFAEIDWDTMLMDPNKLEEQITDKTKAIITVHYWGLPCDMDPIMAIAKKHNLYVIEDSCQAHGAVYKGRKVGTIGHCAAFSMNQNKNFCGGEGGLFATDDEELLVSARALMNFGEMTAPESHRNFHSYSMGWMYRMNDLSAAFARAQLTKLDKTNAMALYNFNKLKAGLEGVKGLKLPVNNETFATNGYAFVIRVVPEEAGLDVDLAKFRDAVVDALTAEGVPVASVRWLLPAHTVIQGKNGYGKGCPWSCHAYGKDIEYNLGLFPVSIRNMNASIQFAINGHRPPNGDAEIDYIIDGTKKVFANLNELVVK